MPGAYTYVLSEAASEYAFRLPNAEQTRLARICRALASAPHRMGDYPTSDEVGHVLQNLLMEDWVITYWADHAVREMRITEIVQV
jgi:hypothetical protein